MAYEVVDNFAAGLDNRKSPIVAPGGTLTRLTNAVINPGGEIEKRRAFIKVADVPGSFGLAATSTSLYVFGRNVLPAAPVLTADGTALATDGTVIQRRIVPDATSSLVQNDFDTFDGKIYLTCRGSSLGDPHFYDDANVADGTLVATEGLNKGRYVRTFQSKIYAVGGKYLYFSAIGNPILWNPPTGAITEVPVTSLSRGNPARCTVAAADIGKFKNGQWITVSGADATHAEANGFHRITNVSSVTNTFILEEVNTLAATAAQTTGVVVDASDTTGRGYINMSAQDADSESMQSVEVYYDKLAVFSTEAVQIWAVDPAPLQNALTQLLRDSGTQAPRSSLQYGSGDVLYLDASGVRSLKAKDSSNSAAVSDIGSPVDAVLRELRRTKGDGYMNGAISLLEPSIGRFWLIFPDHVLALSYFPGPKITAWSEFELPELGANTVQHAVTCAGKVFLRDNTNRIWVYGGAAGDVYGNCGVEVRLPYLNGKKPGHNKIYEAIDMTASGDWSVYVSYEFNNQDTEELVGNFSFPSDPNDRSGGGTWNAYRSALTGYASHMSLRFYNNSSTFAALSNIGIHYQVVDDEQ